MMSIDKEGMKMPLKPAGFNYFVDRMKILNQIKSGLMEPEHYLLLGPRKAGKTSILETIIRLMKNDRRFVVTDTIHCLGEKNFESVVLKMINNLIEKKRETNLLPHTIDWLKSLGNKIIELFDMKLKPYTINLENQSIESIKTCGIP